MARRCSQSSDDGHNTRTCPPRPSALASSATSSSSSSPPASAGVQIFGVKLIDALTIKKSATMGNLASANANPDSSSSNNPNFAPADEYLSDDPCSRAVCSSTLASRRVSRDRKKGVPWTEEEHRRFLIGLQKLGKGDWRGISRNFVKSRTPTQVASHAQKHFMRQSNASVRKRRSSLFDMVADASNHRIVEEEHEVTSSQEAFPFLKLSLTTEASSQGYFQVPVTVPFSFWPTSSPVGDGYRHELVKPVAILPEKPVNVDQFRISYLCFGETGVTGKGLPSVSLKSGGDSSRQSAFRPNVAV